MCLHELSRRISEGWPIKVDGEEYEKLAREKFGNRCPYCSCDLSATVAVIEHLDGMNRYRAGLHVPGNVLVACRRCNGEKRRDDSSIVLAGGAGRRFCPTEEPAAPLPVRPVGIGRRSGRTGPSGRRDSSKTSKECAPSVIRFQSSNASSPAS